MLTTKKILYLLTIKYFYTYTFQCGSETGTGYVLESNGFLTTGNLTYEAAYSKGVVVPTDGDINADIFAFIERKYLNNALTNWFTHVFYRSSEKYDSIPYAFTVFPYQPETYIGGPKPGLDKINYDNDTLLYNGSVSPYDYCLVTGGNKVYAAARLLNFTFTNYDILLQQLQVVRKTSDSFAVQITNGKNSGVTIGKEVSTFSGSFGLVLGDPQVAADNNGNAVFYILESGRSVRVSPIINGTQLAWGAMGRLTGTGAYGGYYYPGNPFLNLDAKNGTAVLCWQDSRMYKGNSTGINIFMRHLDSLDKLNYQPVYKQVRLLASSGGQTNPATLPGSSKQFSLIEYFNGYTGFASPAVEVLDKYNFGAMSVNIYQNQSVIRNYNSKPYLDRNYTIQPEINPSSSNKISLHLFFTKAELDALKAADASIHNPSDLAIIMQPYTAYTSPSAYSPVTGENKITVQSWKAVSGGYYLAIDVKKFKDYMNYFIFPASVTLPLKQSNVQFSDAGNTTKTFIKKMYPNPVTNGVFYVQPGNEAAKEMLVEVFTANGELYYHQNLSYQPQRIHLNNAANGVYTVRITSGKLVYTNPLIINSNNTKSN